jgi:hypothetical protein
MKLKNDFSNIEQFDSIIKSKGFFNLWERFQSDGYDGLDYQELANWQDKFKPLGLTFDYSLDSQPFNFKIV